MSISMKKMRPKSKEFPNSDANDDLSGEFF